MSFAGDTGNNKVKQIMHAICCLSESLLKTYK